MKYEVINKHTLQSDYYEGYGAFLKALKTIGIAKKYYNIIYKQIHRNENARYENDDWIVNKIDIVGITITDYFDDDELRMMKAIVNGEIPIGDFKLNPETTEKIMKKRMKEEENEPNTEGNTQLYNLFDEE